MKRKLFSYLAVFVFLLNLAPALALGQFSGVVYPVRELGNCKDFDSCQAYCTQNPSICISYMERKGLISKEEATKYRTLFGLSTTQAVSSVATSSPLVVLSLSSGTTISGRTALYTSVSGASKVDLYRLDSSSLLPISVGSAVETNSNSWAYSWDTTKEQNGMYSIFSRATVSGKTYDSTKAEITISNTQASTGTTTATSLVTANDLTKLANTISVTEKEADEKEETVRQDTAALASEYLEGLKNAIPEKLQSEEVNTTIALREKAILADIEKAVSESITGTATTSLSRKLISIAIDAKKEIENVSGAKIATSTLDKTFSEKIKDVEDKLSESWSIYFFRVVGATLVDSDQDGVFDYDELYIYNTNILEADTDGDGETDKNEILNQTDPVVAGSVLVHDDPRTTGEEAPDLLTVEGKKEARGIVFKGRALPNSFVTLFVYSDPVIVTIQANENGEWEYTFDRELPDGRHEVYVAVVGGAGKIVAKSRPLPFIKEAEAYTFGEEALTLQSPGLFTPGTIILIVSLVGLALVGVLVLVGVSRRSRKSQTATLGQSPFPPLNPTYPPTSSDKSQTPPNAPPTTL